jgi:hypothetical protein
MTMTQCNQWVCKTVVMRKRDSLGEKKDQKDGPFDYALTSSREWNYSEVLSVATKFNHEYTTQNS